MTRSITARSRFGGSKAGSLSRVLRGGLESRRRVHAPATQRCVEQGVGTKQRRLTSEPSGRALQWRAHVTAPIDATGSATEAQPEAVLGGVEAKAIEGRSLGQIAWMRLKRDKVALGGGIVVLLLLLVAIFAGPITSIYGHGPFAFNSHLIDANLGTPKGAFGGASWSHWVGDN